MNNGGGKMKFCNKCKVSLNDNNDKCILCSSQVDGGNTDSVFPYVPTIYKEYGMFFKLLILISIICCSGCIFLDFLFPTNTNWSLFVVLGFICLFILLKIALFKRYNLPKRIVFQVVIISLLSIIWDYCTGWNRWSITFVVPIICSVASIDMVIIAKVLRLYIEDYLIYFILIALFGLVSILFIVFNWVSNVYPSYICIFLNLISFTMLIVLNFESVVRELNRRLHI